MKETDSIDTCESCAHYIEDCICGLYPKREELKEGVKYDQEKLRWDLLPMGPIREIIKVLMHGSAKYDDHNWQKVALGKQGDARYYNAAMRHLDDWYSCEEKLDPESGLNHLAHAVCCLLFLLWFDMEDTK